MSSVLKARVTTPEVSDTAPSGIGRSAPVAASISHIRQYSYILCGKPWKGSMSTGWRVSLIDDGRTRHFIVGLADREAARELAIARCSDASGVVLLPLKDGDFEKLALVDGQIIESSEIG
jgi:hypothetical protein